MTDEKKQVVLKELGELINRNSLENECNTPDWILAIILFNSFQAHAEATRQRDNWYGGKQSILDSEKKQKW